MAVFKRQIRWVLGAAILLVLISCGGVSPAPITGRKAPPSIKITQYAVQKGDTLFSIAWRNEKNLHKLAATNNLRPPYTIYPGQKINLDTSKTPKKIYAAPKPTTKPITSKKPTSISNTVNKRVSKANAKTTPKVTRQTKTKTLPTTWRWSWPVKGRVVRKFGADSFFKGIDIVSLPGAPVYAAAPGVVVYSGSGLRGYGRLIIIKHSKVYLSAYAHNRKVFVKEGDTVSPKAKIAEVGGDPANARRFYFEIRKDGKPVNPLNYLP